MSSADRLTHTSSAEKGIPGVSGGLSGSKNGFWERLGRSKTVRGALAGLGMLGIGARYDQPAPVDFPQQAVIRNIEDFSNYARHDAHNFGDEVELGKLDELQLLRGQADDYLRGLYEGDISVIPGVVDLAGIASQSISLPRSTGEMTMEQVGRVFSGGEVAVRIDKEAGGGGDNFTNAAGRSLAEAIGSQLDGRSQWQATVALLDDNGLTLEEVKLVHHGDQFELQVGEKTAEALQQADLALGEEVLTKLAHDGQEDGSGDPKVGHTETVQVEENSPPADDPPKENTPPVSGGTGGGTPGSGPGTSGGSSGGAGFGKEAAPTASPSDTGPAKEKVPDPEPAKENVPKLEPAKEKPPEIEAPPEKPPEVVKPPEKPGEEEREAPPARVVPPPRQEIVPPAREVPRPDAGFIGTDRLENFQRIQQEKLAPEEKVVRLKITRDGQNVTGGDVKQAPLGWANVYLRGEQRGKYTFNLPLNGDFGQMDLGNGRLEIARHVRVDVLENGQPGPGLIPQARDLKKVQVGDQLQLTYADGRTESKQVTFVGKADPGEVTGDVIYTCDDDDLPGFDNPLRIVVAAGEEPEPASGIQESRDPGAMSLAAIGAMLAAKREEDKRRRKTWAKSLRGLFGVSVFNQDDNEQLLPGEVRQQDEA